MSKIHQHPADPLLHCRLYCRIPLVLLEIYPELGLTSTDLLVILSIQYCRWASTLPTPALLSSVTGKSPSTVRRSIAKLKALGLAYQNSPTPNLNPLWHLCLAIERNPADKSLLLARIRSHQTLTSAPRTRTTAQNLRTAAQRARNTARSEGLKPTPHKHSEGGEELGGGDKFGGGLSNRSLNLPPDLPEKVKAVLLGLTDPQKPKEGL